VVLPRLAQELGNGRRQGGIADAAVQFGTGTAAGHFQFFLAALRFGGATLGDFHAAAMLYEELSEFFFQRQEDRQILVELGHQAFDDLLDLGHQHALGLAFAGIALAGFGQRVEQLAGRVGLLHEHTAVEHGDLDERHHQAADQLARATFQLALVQHHVEQHADQIDRVLVLWVQAGLAGIDAEAGGAGQHFTLQPLRQRFAILADGRTQRRTGRGLQQRQYRHHLALAQRAVLADRDLRGRGGVLANVAGLLQQLVQGLQQHALLAGIRLATAGVLAPEMLLHVATALGPARGETLRPGRRGLFIITEFGFEARRVARLDQIVHPRRHARVGRGRQWTPRRPHLRHHARGGQLLVQLLVDAADRRAQVALAQFDQHQVHFRRQLAAGKSLMDGHAQMFGADRVVVGIQLGAADQAAQATVQPRQHRLEIAQQHGGEIAHRQPRLQYMFSQKAQAILGRPGQGGFGRQRLATGQCIPGPLQVAGEGGGDVLAAAAQLAHRIQEQQLR